MGIRRSAASSQNILCKTPDLIFRATYPEAQPSEVVFILHLLGHFLLIFFAPSSNLHGVYEYTTAQWPDERFLRGFLRSLAMMSGVSVIQRGARGRACTLSNLPVQHQWLMVLMLTLSNRAAALAE